METGQLQKAIKWGFGSQVYTVGGNQSFQQILPKHWKLDWGLNLQRSACCLQLVNVLPLISTTSSAFFFLLSFFPLPPSLLTLSPHPRGKEFEVAFFWDFLP